MSARERASEMVPVEKISKSIEVWLRHHAAFTTSLHADLTTRFCELVADQLRVARELAYRDASGEVHKEARWTHEQTMRGTPPDPLDRLLMVERILLARADELTYPTDSAATS